MNHTIESLKAMRLYGMARAYEEYLNQPDSGLDVHELLAHIIQQERDAKQSKKMQLLLANAKLRYSAHIEGVRYSAERNLLKSEIKTLASCDWIEQSRNVLITGATGCGKSYLSCALGHQACLMGHKTLYLNMNKFIDRIALAKADGSYLRLLHQMEKTNLIILDDFGLQPLNADTRLALLSILEDRYGRRAIVIASQLPVAAWYEYIDDATLADAILDRVTANSIRIELKGNSQRQHH
jgi:DNA replication protein DnaC